MKYLELLNLIVRYKNKFSNEKSLNKKMEITENFVKDYNTILNNEKVKIN